MRSWIFDNWPRPIYPEMPDNSERVRNQDIQAFLYACFSLGNADEVTGDMAHEVTP